MDLKYSYTRISAPPNAATAAMPNGQKEEKNPGSGKTSSGETKPSNNAKPSNEAKSSNNTKEESGGLGTAAIAGIVVVGAAAVGGLLLFAKGASKGAASVAATQNRPANFTNTPPPPRTASLSAADLSVSSRPASNAPESKKTMDNKPKFCTNCGAPLMSGAKFCENCGAKV